MPYDSGTASAKLSPWDKRVERAAALARRFAYAGEILGFYGAVLDLQRKIYHHIPAQTITPAADIDSFRQQLEAQSDHALRYLAELVALVERKGTAKLAKEAEAVRAASNEQQREMITLYAIQSEGEHPFFARTLLQPIAEWLAQCVPSQNVTLSTCPVCGVRPQAAVLRPEGDGGKRFLLCSLCLTEWEFRRILCPVCGEEDHKKLPRYTADDYNWVRVEACDTCHFYLKSIDLTVDGLAVPLVDEVATAPLDVWATGHDYQKTEPNLMGF